MEFHYSSNINVQLLVALLKEHQIKKIIASPGTTNLEMIVSLQSDEFFEMYSCVDERSAAYMACGLAEESREPVVIVCTEATASRNYYPALTEAYHRKLPILAITGMHDYNFVGHLEPQVINRSVSPEDTLRFKVNLPVIEGERDIRQSEFLINQALLELRHHGGGPVHINLPWGGGNFDFTERKLPKVRIIRRFNVEDRFPEITASRIAVYVGSHALWSEEQTNLLDCFCACYDAVVFCDHSSKFYGKYRVQPALLSTQRVKSSIFQNIDLLIHIGEEAGDVATVQALGGVKEVWRVSPDGELRDTFKKLRNVFEMSESFFFNRYIEQATMDSNDKSKQSYLDECRKCISEIKGKIPELPFSNIYVASKIALRLPAGSVIHFGASDTIRAWTLFDLPKTVHSGFNAGCRGIDGTVSSLIGASLAKPDTIFFGVVGDLTFFYDMNVLGNRSIGNNVRILLINNDGGNIFRHSGHASQTWLGFEKSSLFVAAGGHFGAKSPELVKGYAGALGFEYLSASDRHEFEEKYFRFITPELTEKPMLFEVFVDAKEDAKAFDVIGNINVDTKSQMKDAVKHVLGEQGTNFFRKIMK